MDLDQSAPLEFIIGFAFMVKVFLIAIEYMRAADVISRQHFHEKIYWQENGQKFHDSSCSL